MATATATTTAYLSNIVETDAVCNTMTYKSNTDEKIL